jgi:hypothetical protein
MYHRYKKTIESELNSRFRLVLTNTRESDEANAVRSVSLSIYPERTTVLTNEPIQSAYSQMVEKLKEKPELLKHIIPDDFNVACRRPTPGNGYLEALAGPKSHVFTNNIGGITKKGVIDSATGTEVSIC